jgi:hypothetical protein
MASTNDVIFPESMADILANPVDICFSFMLAKSTAPAACLVIESNAVTSNQQVETDLLTETHLPTPRNLIAGIDRVEGMLSDTIKVCGRVKHPRRTPSSPSSMPLGLRNAAHVASRYMKRKIQIESGPKTHQIVETAGVTSTNPTLSTRIPNTWLTSAMYSRSFDDLLSQHIAAGSTERRLRTA